MNNEWHNIHITDKSCKVMFNTTACPTGTMSEIRNLKRHIAQAKANPEHYKFLDVATAVVMLDGVVYSEPELSADDIDSMLAELAM